MEWKKTDPRFDINKRAKIIIYRPDISPGIGYVDTKEDWLILTSFEDHKVISADDKWDPDWFWIFAP